MGQKTPLVGYMDPWDMLDCMESRRSKSRNFDEDSSCNTQKSPSATIVRFQKVRQ